MGKLPWLLWVVLWAWFGCTPHTESREPARVAAATATAAAPIPERPPRLFLWKTRSGAATAYLLGSIHVASPDIYPLDERIDQAFMQSDTLVLEVDADDEEMVELMSSFVEHALLPPGQSLYDSLTPQLAERLKAKLQELGLDPKRMSGFKLWFVTMMLSLRTMEAAGYSGEHGIDMHFRGRAEGKLPILGLEAPEDQLKLMTTMSNQAVEDDLEMALSNEEVEQLGVMFEQWQRGDVAGLTAQLGEMREAYPELYADMFTRRNHVMADGIARLLAKPGTYFVVVGAGHLVGEDSVIQLLRERGLNVERQ